MKPDRLLEILDERAAAAPLRVHVYWWRVDGSRTEVAAALVQSRRMRAVVPLIPHDGFQNANALLTDLGRLCLNNEDAFRALPDESQPPLILVILSREPLGVPQVSSPVTLPGCVRWWGGKEVWVAIEDIEREADGQLNTPELAVSDLAHALFEIERVMVARLIAVRASNHGLINSLHDQLKADSKADEKADEFLAGCLRHLDGQSSPSGYRPTLRATSSLLARLIGLISRLTPAQLQRPAKALMVALAAEGFATRESLQAVLARPGPGLEHSTRQGINLLQTCYAAVQLTTASAHAGDYGRYPLELLAAVSRDLRASLIDVSHAIEMLAPVSSTQPRRHLHGETPVVDARQAASEEASTEPVD